MWAPIDVQLLDKLHNLVNDLETDQGLGDIWSAAYWYDSSYEWRDKRCMMRAIKFVKALATCFYHVDWSGAAMNTLTNILFVDTELYFRWLEENIPRVVEHGDDVSSSLSNCFGYIAKLRVQGGRILERLAKLAHPVLDGVMFDEFTESVQQYVMHAPGKPSGWGRTPHDYSLVEANYGLTAKHLGCFTYWVRICIGTDQNKKLQSRGIDLVFSILHLAHTNDFPRIYTASIEERILRSSSEINEMSLKLHPCHNSDAIKEYLEALLPDIEGGQSIFLSLLHPTAQTRAHLFCYTLVSSPVDVPVDDEPVETLLEQVDQILGSNHQNLIQKLRLIKAELFVMATSTSFDTIGEALAFLNQSFETQLVHMVEKEKLIVQLVQYFLREAAGGFSRNSEDMIKESSLAIFHIYKAESLFKVLNIKSNENVAIDALHIRSFQPLTICQTVKEINEHVQFSSELDFNLEEIIAVYEKGSLTMFDDFIKSNRVFMDGHLMVKLRKLMTNKPHTFALMKDKVVTFLGELELLGSFLKDVKTEDAGIWLRVMCVIYEAEYIIDMFLSGDAPVWYQHLLIFNAIHDTNSIKVQIPDKKSFELPDTSDDHASIIEDLLQTASSTSFYFLDEIKDEGAREYWRTYVYDKYVQNSSVHWSDTKSTMRATKFLKTIQFFYNTDDHGGFGEDGELAVQCHRRKNYVKWLHHEIHQACEEDPQHIASALCDSFRAIGTLRVEFVDTCNQLMKVPLPDDGDMFDELVDLVLHNLEEGNHKVTMHKLEQFRYSVRTLSKLCQDQKRLQSLLTPAVTVVSSIQQLASRNETNAGEMEEIDYFPSALDTSRKVLRPFSRPVRLAGSESFLDLLQAAQNHAHIFFAANPDLSIMDIIAHEPDDNWLKQEDTNVAGEKLITGLILSFLREIGSLCEYSEDKILELSFVILQLYRSEALVMVVGYSNSRAATIDKILLFFRQLVSSTPNGNVSTICVALETNAKSVGSLGDSSVVMSFQEIARIYMRDLLWLFNSFPRSDGPFFAKNILEKLRQFETNLPDTIAFMKDQFQAFLRDLEFLIISFLTDMSKNKHLGLRVNFFVYAAEYIVDMFMLGDGPLCYHQLVLFIAMEEAQFFKTQILLANCCSESPLQDIQIQLTSKGSNLKTAEVAVGFDDHVKNIVELLETGSQNLQVVSIVGMAGIGKTTLAKKVYSTLLSKGRFAVCAGSSVSQVYRKRELLFEILGDISIVTDDVKKMDDNDLALMVFRSLKGKRYLILLDDLWMIEHWNDLIISFPDEKRGSKILLTTRVRRVAEEANTIPPIEPYFLPLLSVEQSWNLLQKKVFPSGRCPEKLHDVGRLVAEHCKGLPLAIVVIAGILEKMQEQKGEWEKIAAHLRSRVAEDEEAHFMGILELSYSHLPSHLKPCFLYLGSFLEDQEIPVKKLQWLWMGEGFIPKMDDKSLEETAGGYLVELINRSLIMESKRCSLGGVRTCRIHDMLRDLSLKKAKEENFMQLISMNGSNESEFPANMQYRVCVHSPKQNFIELKCSASHVHSLLFFSTDNSQDKKSYDVSSILRDHKLIRVLDLEPIKASIFPSGADLLLGLNYLAIKGNIKSIPTSITKLWSLETLIVKGTRGEVKVPSTLWSMTTLRNVHIRPRASLTFSKPELDNGLPLLENLSTISSPVFSDRRDAEKILKKWMRLTKLRCVFMEQTDYSGCNVFPPMEFLSQLESLSIYYIGKTFPCKFSFPLNLKKLTLSRFCLPWNYIILISKLSHLEVLKLLFKSFDGDVWDVNEQVFPKLKVLMLENLKLSKWNAEDCSDSFPELERLVLRSCKMLEEVPSGLGVVPTLKQIVVEWCTTLSASNSVQTIYEQQVEYGNPNFDVAIIPSEWNFSRSS